MAKRNSTNLDVTVLADGFDITGGTTGRKLTATGADITLTGSGTQTYTFPAATDTLCGIAATQELDNKTLDSSVGKGTWTASGTWTLPAVTLGGAITGGSQSVSALGTVGCGTVTIANGSSLNLQEDITFTGATTENMIKMPDNLADALNIKEGTTSYLSFTTTNGSESVNLNQKMVLTENTSIQLDPAGSAKDKYTGITVTGTAGATVAFGDLITLDKDDSRWELVDISVAAAATGDARGILGMAVSAGNDGDAITILLEGIIRADDNFPTLTIGAPVYASTTGDVVVAQPTTTDYVIRIVGSALTADEMFFRPDFSYTTHT